MADKESSVFEQGVVVVIVIAFLLVGVGILAASPVQSPPPSEDETSSVLLLPNADSGIHQERTEIGCTEGSSYLCVTSQDGNTSYWVGNGRQTSHMENLTLPDGAGIDSVTLFVWARLNTSTTTNTYLVTVERCEQYVGGDCVAAESCTAITLFPVVFTGGQAYANYTSTAVTCDTGGVNPWTEQMVDDLLYSDSCLCGSDPPNPIPTTQQGIVVTYTIPGVEATPAWNLALLLPFVMVAVAVVFVVALAVEVARSRRDG